MKKVHRLFSVVLIAVLVFSSMAVPANADSSYGYVTVTVKQDYGEVQKVLKRLNAERAKRGLRKVKLDKTLTEAAVKRAAETTIFMNAKHLRPDGRKYYTINKKANCENWAAGYPTGTDVVNAWMKSPGHKKNNLYKDARSVGIAFVTSGNGDPLCILLVSKSKVSKKLTKKSGTKNYNVKVKAKTKYLKKSFFSIGTAKLETLCSTGYDEVYVKPGTSTQLYVHHASKYAGLSNTCYTRLKSTSSYFDWSSNDNSIASVSANGVLTAKKEGWVTITAKMKKAPKHTIKSIIYVSEEDPYEWIFEDDF